MTLEQKLGLIVLCLGALTVCLVILSRYLRNAGR